ncbi:portal protein [Pseudomonas sp. MONT-RG-20F-20-E-7-02]|uniref:portal protein n=1 Tax=Pseudomonas sp. MONT-RG-20F-20-E-7-02 TaxID=2914979 RepID=UPI001F5974EF|nr:portal protein [Pseudomonas sp. MONT-RG-20F-20-E-7-02]
MTDRTEDEELIAEAKARFQRCQDFEGDFRKLFTDDLKFVNADSDNGYQWPDAMRMQRQDDAKPCLTINKTRQHALMVINEAKEHKPSVKVSAVGGDASFESAQVYEGVIRHIEYQSNATDAYDTALEFQVKAGIGYWRVVTDYMGDDSFDQEIYIRRIRNPLSVRLDPDIKELDGSDASFGFISDDMRREDFERKYPASKDEVSDGCFGEFDEWCTKDNVRVAEYYYKTFEKDTLVALPLPDGQGGERTEMILLSELRAQMPDLAKVAMADKTIQRRTIQKPKVKWCLIAGDKIIDRSEWLGVTIPIVRVVGEEMIIDGKLDRKGHVRNLKDPQRMYNYWTSSATEHVALQTKTPYLADTQSIEGFETIWENANSENVAYLPYNSVNDQGQPLAPPQRVEAPVMSSAYMAGMQMSAEEMKMVSGQNDALMGAPSQEISGVAIGKRTRQADRATMQYRDNLAKAVRYTGKILIDLIPKVYDTPRVIRILAEDGSDDTVKIDPSQQQPMVETPKDDGTDGVNRAFNPAMGQYEVIAESGPSYATKQAELFEALSQQAQQDPTFMSIAGDLYFRASGLPLSDEFAERYKNSIPANVRGEGPSPEMQQAQQELQQAQQQVQALQAQLAASMQAAADADKKADDKAKANEINAFKAVTDRLDGLMDKLDPIQAAILASQAVAAALKDPEPIDSSEPDQVGQQPPLPVDAPPQPPMGQMPLQ